ncbi:unnamed protein product [Rotaria sp. Silwood1]|nr:unnamed protein product [Rotaria sp. Silwood1]CAF1690914.1 unnamed protein product [Rotaria sp. Silwood1]
MFYSILLPAILNQNQSTTTTPSSVVETNPIPLEKLTESTNNDPVKEMTEDELIKEIQMSSQARYVTPQPPYRTSLFVCHHCQQPGHIKSQCPSILIGSTFEMVLSNDKQRRSLFSSIPFCVSDDFNSNNKDPNRNLYINMRTCSEFFLNKKIEILIQIFLFSKHEVQMRLTTGIPCDRLIPVPTHIPDTLRDQTGASVVPRQIAELYVERIEKKDALGQSTRETNEKNVSLSNIYLSTSADEEPPPNDLLRPICKRIYVDAGIIPCCNLSFSDDCIRTALIDSPEHECPHRHCQHVAIDQINPNLYLRNHIKRWHERQNQSSYSHMSLSQHTSQTLDQDSDKTPTNLRNSNDNVEYDPDIPSTNSQQSTASIKTAPIIIKIQPHEKKHHGLFRMKKKERETPPAQLTPANPIYTILSPSTNAVFPHYYPTYPPHHNIIYPHHIPPKPAYGLYPIQT